MGLLDIVKESVAPIADSMEEEPKPKNSKKNILKEKPPSVAVLIDEAMNLQKSREPYLRPSGLFGCTRANVFRLLRAPMSPSRKDNRIQRILDNGTAVHEVVQRYIGRHPDYWFSPETPVLKNIEGVLVKGSCDGIITRRSDGYRWALEIKTIGSEFDNLRGPKREHVLQASIYARLHEVYWITIVYWDKQKQYIKEYDVGYDAARWDSIKERIISLVDYRSDVGGDDWETANYSKLVPYSEKECDPYFCDYYEFCAKKGGPVL